MDQEAECYAKKHPESEGQFSESGMKLPDGLEWEKLIPR